jgi:nucleosome assembly protein 1-like 1
MPNNLAFPPLKKVSVLTLPSLMDLRLIRIRLEDGDRANAAAMLAQNPALVSMIEGKLGSLVGRSSGYVENLPAPVRRRVTGLKGIQKDHAKLEAAFQEEVLQLEKKYFAKFTPLYQKRAEIIKGNIEPTEEEIEAGKAEQEDDAATEPETKIESEAKEDMKGIPEFWLSAMKNQVSLAEMINDRDEEALRPLIDIRMEYLDRPGFKLIFEFAPNDFFTNKTLSKTYYYREENGFGGDFIYDHAEGDKIDWKAGKDVTVRVESKKQRNKSKRPGSEKKKVVANPRLATKQTRVVKKTVPTESFFNFFNPPKAPSEGESVESEDDIEERLELDYTIGEDIKEKLIPHAVSWFTGEALQFEELDEEDLEDDDSADEDDEDEDDEEDSRDEEEESADEV